MADHPGWYPPGQVCYPPDLPTYLKNVYDLKPFIGVPSDDEVIGIHAVMQAANRTSGIPGMHDSRLLVGLADHLFGAQMARYRSKYSLVVFPSDATYTPPALPAHIPIVLEPVSGAPLDEEITDVQDAIRAYQQFTLTPSMFDAHVNMELSQHLFNLQMARYVRRAGESQPSPVPVPREIARPASPVQTAERAPNRTEETTSTTNNAGTGASNVGVYLTSPLAPGIDTHGERSNSLAGQSTRSADQLNLLAERFNQVLERLTQLLEKVHQPANEPDQLAERFSQLFDRLDQVLERSNQPVQQANLLAERANLLTERSNLLVEQLGQPVQQSNHLAERFNRLFEQSNQLLSQLSQPMQRSNQLAERLNQLIEGFNQPLQSSTQLSKEANQLAGQLNRSTENSNQIAEQANKHWEQLGGAMKNINKILVGVQHAIVRNHKGNTLETLDCLVNEAGKTPGLWGGSPQCPTIKHLLKTQGDSAYCRIPVVINGVNRELCIQDHWLGALLRFFGISDGLCEISGKVLEGKVYSARERLSEYLSSCLG